MPFTPFHMGPGLLLKAVMQGSFSLMVFGWAQIVMDIQPLIVMITGEGHLHGFTHTLIGATLLGAVSALTGKYLAELGLRLLDLQRFIPIRWPIAIISAYVGTYSHVMLDAIMHADLQPFAPSSLYNPLLGTLSVATLHKLCVYSGLVGGALYFAVTYWIATRRSSH
jgi:hypothetical protein